MPSPSVSPRYSTTAIIPFAMCIMLWQCSNQRPGLFIVICTVTELPAMPIGATSTVSFTGGNCVPPAVPSSRKKWPWMCIGWYCPVPMLVLVNVICTWSLVATCIGVTAG